MKISKYSFWHNLKWNIYYAKFFFTLHDDKWVSNNLHTKNFFLSEVRPPYEVSLFDGTDGTGTIPMEVEISFSSSYILASSKLTAVNIY